MLGVRSATLLRRLVIAVLVGTVVSVTACALFLPGELKILAMPVLIAGLGLFAVVGDVVRASDRRRVPEQASAARGWGIMA
jgi:hypothetical protein